MSGSTDIPNKDGYYWVRLQKTWPPQVIEYVGGVVFVMGSRQRYSAYYDVYCWYDRIEGMVE